MDLEKKWSFILLGLGLICWAFFYFLSFRTDPIIKSTDLAVIESFIGDVYILRLQPFGREKVQGRIWLKKSETIETMAGSDSILEFPSNYRVKIAPESRLSLDLWNDRPRVVIQRGDVSIENYGRDGDLYFSKDGQVFNATDYGLFKEKQLIATDKSSEPSLSSPRLHQKMIEDVLKNSRSSFYKCYSQLLQKNPGLVGQASLAFVILPTGKVQQPEVSNSSLSDPQFKKCLIAVLERVEFPSFSGAAINTIFPLKFE